MENSGVHFYFLVDHTEGEGCMYTFVRLSLAECSANDRDVLSTLCKAIYKEQLHGSIESRANKKAQLCDELRQLKEEIDSAEKDLLLLPGVELFGGSVIDILLQNPMPWGVDLLEDNFPRKDDLLRKMKECRQKGEDRLDEAKALSVVKSWLEDSSPGPGRPSVEWDIIKKMSEVFHFLVSRVPEVREVLIQNDD